MSEEQPIAMKNVRAVQPDAELAAQQWAEWRSSRRHLLKMGMFAGAGIAGAGLIGSSHPSSNPRLRRTRQRPAAASG